MDLQQQQQLAAGEASSYRRRRDQALAEAWARDLREFEAFVRASAAGTTRDRRRHQAADAEDQRLRQASGGATRLLHAAAATDTETPRARQQPGQGPGGGGVQQADGLGEQQGEEHGGEAPLDLELRL